MHKATGRPDANFNLPMRTTTTPQHPQDTPQEAKEVNEDRWRRQYRGSLRREANFGREQTSYKMANFARKVRLVCTHEVGVYNNAANLH